MIPSDKKRLIGRSEKVSFPDLGLVGIEAKVDTGAYTTALHCHDICLVKEGDKHVLNFRLLDPSHPEYSDIVFKFNTYSLKTVRSSFGDTEERYRIKTRIRLGKKVIKAFVTLTNRGSMQYPVLIGRKLLEKRFVVDVEFSNLLPNR
jgi:hypothetical protein